MSRRPRKCGWELQATDLDLWWAPRLQRWVRRKEVWCVGFLTTVRRCDSRIAALRAARGLAALGGGTLIRVIAGGPLERRWRRVKVTEILAAEARHGD